MTDLDVEQGPCECGHDPHDGPCRGKDSYGVRCECPSYEEHQVWREARRQSEDPDADWSRDYPDGVCW